MEFYANGGVLERKYLLNLHFIKYNHINTFTNEMKYEEFAVLGVFLAFFFLINNLYTYHAYGEIVVDDIVRYPGVRYFLIRVRRCRIRQLY